MELSEKLFLRKYWKVEEILLLLFNRSKSVEIKRDFYVEEDFTLLKSKFEKKISKAIKSGDLKTHKALDDDNSDYLDRNGFFVWLLASKYGIDINRYLRGGEHEAVFYDGPDYLDFSDRVYGGGTFTRHEAFCYLRGISTTQDKTTWSDDDIRKHLKFDAYENNKERLNCKEILVIAGKAGLPVPDEMQIPIDEAKKFGTHDQKKTASSWHDITLTLLANNLIEYSCDGTKFKKSLEEFGLATQGNKELTMTGEVLFKLSHQVKHLNNIRPIDSERQIISRIRDALRKLCGLTGDPFQPFNKDDGYKLKCKLFNETKAGDQREEKRAIHVQYNDDELIFDIEDNEGQRYMDDPDNYNPNIAKFPINDPNVDDEDNDPNVDDEDNDPNVDDEDNDPN